MFRATDTARAPWYVARTDDKERGRLIIVAHLLGKIPYEPLPHRAVSLLGRQQADGYREAAMPLPYIPTPY